MFLLGRQAMFGHDPPTYLRSITATRFPSLANVQAATVDPVPPPRITRSYSSGSVFLLDRAEELFPLVCIHFLLLDSLGTVPVLHDGRCIVCRWRDAVLRRRDGRHREHAGRLRLQRACPELARRSKARVHASSSHAMLEQDFWQDSCSSRTAVLPGLRNSCTENQPNMECSRQAFRDWTQRVLLPSKQN